jgi:hypothetical protein
MREMIDGIIKVIAKEEINKEERKVVYRKSSVQVKIIQSEACDGWREVIHSLWNIVPKSKAKVGKSSREIIYSSCKVSSKSELNKRWRKMINELIEIIIEFKMREGRGEVIDGSVERHPQSKVSEKPREVVHIIIKIVPDDEVNQWTWEVVDRLGKVMSQTKVSERVGKVINRKVELVPHD